MASDETGESHPNILVSIEKAERELIPAVLLEHREISIADRPSDVPCIVMVTDVDDRDQTDEDADTIVGENGSLGSANGLGQEVETVAMEMMSSEHTSRSTVRLERVEVPIRESLNIMEFFEEQEKSFQEQVRTFPKIKSKPSTLTAIGPLRQSVGLDHLDNLVKLMEQLTNLRDENSQLKKRCEYLESTKFLLEVTSSIEAVPQGYQTLPAKPRHRKQEVDALDESETSRSRTVSVADTDTAYLDAMETDKALRRSSHTKLKRSYSTGSMVSSEEESHRKIALTINTKRTVHQRSSPKSLSKSMRAKHKTAKFSKWIVVRQKLEDLSTTLKSRGKVSHVRHHSVGTSSELTVPTAVGLSESRSVDSGVGSGIGDAETRVSTSLTDSPTPTPMFVSRTVIQEPADSEFFSGIWMGPPGWEEKQDGSGAVGQDGTSIQSSDIPHLVIKLKPAARRQSSPTLFVEEPIEIPVEIEERTSSMDSPCLSRSVSYGKDGKDDGKSADRFDKKAQKIWGKVKGIIGTGRKDSVKRKPKKSSLDAESYRSEEPSDVDGEYAFVLEPERSETDQSSPGHLGPESFMDLSSQGVGSQSTALVAALMGNMSEEYSRKMQAWSDMKSKNVSSFSKDPTEGANGSATDHVQALPEPTKRKGSLSPRLASQEKDSSGDVSPDSSSSPLEIPGHGVNVDELQSSLSDSFSRKMKEWSDKNLAPPERKDSKSKDDKTKSKKIDKDREKELLKLEKLREKEKQKVERKQQRLEKDRVKLDKDRLRALDREAKIEKMKERLSQSDIEAFKSPILSPLSQYKITADFAKKLHEWELMKGLPHETSAALYLEAKQRGLQLTQQFPSEEAALHKHASSINASSGSKLPTPLTLQACYDSPENISPIEKMSCHSPSETSIGNESSTTEESFSGIPSLEKVNSDLITELTRKELEYSQLEEEVQNLDDKLLKVKAEHSREIDIYKKELIKASHPGSKVSMESEKMAATMLELEKKITELESFGEKLTMSMESAAVGKWQSMSGEENVNIQLMQLVDKMKEMLATASQTEEAVLKSAALHNYEKLYSHAMQLQIQMNNLRLSHLQRNKEIMNMKRQLLIQEVNNLLLQVDITKRESELYVYREGKRKSTIKRWSTYSGSDRRVRVVEGKESDERVPLQRYIEATHTTDRAPLASPVALASDQLLKDSQTLGSTRLSPSSTHPKVTSPVKASTNSIISQQPTQKSKKTTGGSRHDVKSKTSKSKGKEKPGETTASGTRTSQPDSFVVTSHVNPQLSSRTFSFENYTIRQLQGQSSSQTFTCDHLLTEPSVPILPTYSIPTMEIVRHGESMELEQGHLRKPDGASSDNLDSCATDDVKIASRSSGDGQIEFSPIVTLPSTSARPPRDISETEHHVPKLEKKTVTKTLTTKCTKASSRILKVRLEGFASDSELDTGQRGESLREWLEREPKFPEVIIPEWRKSAAQSKLTKSSSSSIVCDSRASTNATSDDSSRVIHAEHGPHPAAIHGPVVNPLPHVKKPRRQRVHIVDPMDTVHILATPPRQHAKSRILQRTRAFSDGDEILSGESGSEDRPSASSPGLHLSTRELKPILKPPSGPHRDRPYLRRHEHTRSTPASQQPPIIASDTTTQGTVSVEKKVSAGKMISKFEKQASFSETAQNTLELRKTPSPTIHIPQVGLVTPIRRLKPAAELLQESQRHRTYVSSRLWHKTHSPDRKSRLDETLTARLQNKENVADSYVQQIIQRLSREGTPLSGETSPKASGSSPSQARRGSPKMQSEFVQHIVRRLSNPSEPNHHSKPHAPLKDLTNNNGQVRQLTESFDSGSLRSSPERCLSDSDSKIPKSRTRYDNASKRKSCEFPKSVSIQTAPEPLPQLISIPSTSSVKHTQCTSPAKPDSTISAFSFSSMPILCCQDNRSSDGRGDSSGSDDATASTVKRTEGPASPTITKGKPGHNEQHKKLTIAIPPPLSPTSKRPFLKISPTVKKTDTIQVPSPIISRRKEGKITMGTIGELCRHSISFDLGVTLQASTTEGQAMMIYPESKSEGAEAGAEAEQSSINTEEVPDASTSGDKKKAKSRIFDSNWYQKSKRLFKVSKC